MPIVEKYFIEIDKHILKNKVFIFICVSLARWGSEYRTFFSIHPSPGLLPVLGPLERYMTPTLNAALLISSRAGADVVHYNE